MKKINNLRYSQAHSKECLNMKLYNNNKKYKVKEWEYLIIIFLSMDLTE